MVQNCTGTRLANRYALLQLQYVPSVLYSTQVQHNGLRGNEPTNLRLNEVQYLLQDRHYTPGGDFFILKTKTFSDAVVRVGG